MPHPTAKQRTIGRLNRMSAKASASSGPPGYGTTVTNAGPWFLDYFRGRRAPSLPELTDAFKGIVFACATLNANGVARVPLRLYATTSRGQGRPKCSAKPVGVKSLRYLSSHKTYSKALTGTESVDEVIDHPLLDVLSDINSDFDHNLLIRWSVLCLDVIGSCYWWPELVGKDVPIALWPLMAQYVLPIRDPTGSAVKQFNYFGNTYLPEDLVRVRHPGVRDPYAGGYGPTQAAFSYVGLSDQYASVQENLLNSPRPSILISNKNPTENMGEKERARFEREVNYRLAGAGSGRAWVVDGSVDVNSFSFPPTDLAALDIDERAVQRVANCFGTPLSLLKTEDVNLANAEAGHRQHAELGIEPRCVMIASGLTKWTKAKGRSIGDNGWERLFWAFDDPVPEDKEREAKVFGMYVANGVMAINAVRSELSEDPVPWGDEPWMSNTLVQPSIAAEQREQANKVQEQAAAREKPEGETPQPQPESIEELDETSEGEPPTAKAKGLNGNRIKALLATNGHAAKGDEDARLLAKMERLLDAVGARLDDDDDDFGLKYNPNHDARGRFAHSPGHGRPAHAAAIVTTVPDKRKPASGGGGGGSGDGPGKPGKPEAGKPEPEKPKPVGKPQAEKPKLEATEKPAEKPKPQAGKPAEKPKPAPEKTPEKPADLADSSIKERTSYHNSMSKDWHKNLTDTEKASLQNYTNISYSRINSYHRKGDPGDMNPKSIERHWAALDSALSKSGIKEPVVVYRGVSDIRHIGLDSKDLGKLVGKTAKDKGYLSTSLNPSTAHSFLGDEPHAASALFRISVPKGAKGASVAGSTMYAHENEVVFGRGSKLKITKATRHKDGHIVIDAEYVE